MGILDRAKDVLTHVVAPRAARQSNEQPHYSIVRTDGDFEIRDYAPMLVAEVVCEGDQDQATSKGFEKLFAYISGKERDGDKIEMTSPVLHERLDEKRYAIRFVMPQKWTRDTLPPAKGQDVTFTEMAAQRVASVRFSGTAGADTLQKQTARLREWMSGAGLQADATPLFAIYDPPFSPPPARRNEVLIPTV
jgi:DNA gyrase inhibitor GyrI